MFKVLVSAAALGLLTTAAYAADLPVYEEVPEVVPVLVPAWSWSGLYAGVHAGYSWGESDVEGLGTLDDFDGPLGGGQIGVNWQWNWAVLGIEADGSYARAHDSLAGGGAILDLETEWMASVRGRLGVGFNRFLVYGTGGAAWAHIDADLFGGGVVAAGITSSDDQTHFGWVGGGGVEMMATQNITVGVEYLHYEFDDETYDLPGPVDIDYDTDVIRGRVNVKFNGLFGG